MSNSGKTSDSSLLFSSEKRISGYMKEIIFQHDWSKTALGDRTTWDPALTTAVNICLGSRFPTLLLWGDDMLRIYNDAYREIIDEKHRSIGTKVEDVWSELWPKFRHILNKVYHEQESILIENQPYTISRNGLNQECYFTTSYSPVYSSNGSVGGVLIVTQDTTRNVVTEQKLKTLTTEQLRNLFIQAPLALCILKGDQLKVEVVNKKMLALWGKSLEQVIDKPFFEGVPEAKNQGFESMISKVYKEGERVVIEESSLFLERQRGKEMVYIKFVYEPLRDETGTITGVMALADEITDQVMARKQIEESEIRQKIAIEAAAIGTFDWSMEDSVFQHSDRLAQIFGVNDTGALAQKALGDMIHPDDQPARIAAHQQAFENGILFYESRILWKDQSLHWIRVNGKVIYNIYGKPSRMYGTVLDITEQRQQSERLEKLVEQRTQNLQERNNQLARSEERYHKMIDEVQDYAIIMLDRDGVIQNWNKGAEKIKFYKEGEIVGKNFRIFYMDEDRASQLPERLINDATLYGRAMHEGWRVRKDGSKFWGSITITALHNDNHDIIGFSKVTRDLTERKLAEDKMKAYMLELEAQNQELEQFAYVASHDLQEPLRKIQTFCEVIQKNEHSEETSKKYFPKIISAAQRMADLIKSVLNYSRLSKDKPSFVVVDLNTIIGNILTDFELLITEKQAVINYTSLPSIVGVPLQISQLFTNLISNALKFTTSDPKISISSRIITGNLVLDLPILLPHKEYAEITVEDNGIGFDQKYEKLIFAMFQRLNSKHEYAGTGIGLALCKKIIENHHGHIVAKSELGKGSTFYVYLPTE